MHHGQSELLAIVILVGVVLVVGIGFLGILSPSISDLISRNRVRLMLYNEQSLLVLYREYEDRDNICIGILRIEPGEVAYALTLFIDGMSMLNAINIYTPPGWRQGVKGIFLRRYVNTASNGEYYPCFVCSDMVEVLYIYTPLNDVIPALVCVSKNNLPKGATKATLYLFTQVGLELYEVGRYEIHIGG